MPKRNAADARPGVSDSRSTPGDRPLLVVPRRWLATLTVVTVLPWLIAAAFYSRGPSGTGAPETNRGAAPGDPALAASGDQLPSPQSIDEEHRRWRAVLIHAGRHRSLHFTHGVAAKIINLYLKSRFVCGGYHAHKRVQSLHPPIDSLLLLRLAELDFGGQAREWKRAAEKRWSKFDSDSYEEVVALIRQSLKGAPLWKIEEHWRGNR